MGGTEILSSFRFVLEGKTCKETPEPSRLQLMWYAGLTASRTLLQSYFRIRRFIMLVKTKKNNFKQLKTMEISEAWPDTYDEGYMHQYIKI